MRALLVVAVLVLAATPAAAVERKAVDAAVERGVAALRKMQRPDGTWDYPDIGATALAGLTLVECGVAKSDKAVTAAAAKVRQASLTLTHTYSLALSVLFLDSLGESSDTPLIESMIVRLLAGQARNGAWAYHCPSISAQESRRLLAEAGGGRVLKAGRDLAKLPTRGQRTVKDVAPEIRAQLQVIARGGAGGPGGGDNSNTQFAILGLWVGRRYGVPTQPALIRTAQYFRATQRNGSWGYTAVGANMPIMAGMPGMGATPTMTCAGILGLAFGHGSIRDGKKSKDPKAPPRDISGDASIKAGLAALGGTIGAPVGWDGSGARPPAVAPIAGKGYYFLWSLERVAVGLKLETIGKKKWYDWGAEILLANQGLDGSWSGEYAACGADTCFALLFLKRANFTRDLSSGLAGMNKLLRAGGVGGDALRASPSSLGEVGIGKKTKPEGKKPTPAGRDTPTTSATDKKPPEKTIPRTGQEKTVDRLSDDLVKANAERRGAILKEMRDTRGVAYTEALVASISRLDGDARKEARIALAERLTRMKPATLRDYLGDDEAEIRRAAALATAAKKNKAHVPDLVRLLNDPESLVRRAAHHALTKLTGKDFGPDEEATVVQRKKAIAEWRKWWQAQSRE